MTFRDGFLILLELFNEQRRTNIIFAPEIVAGYRFVNHCFNLLLTSRQIHLSLNSNYEETP